MAPKPGEAEPAPKSASLAGEAVGRLAKKWQEKSPRISPVGFSGKTGRKRALQALPFNVGAGRSEMREGAVLSLPSALRRERSGWGHTKGEVRLKGARRRELPPLPRLGSRKSNK